MEMQDEGLLKKARNGDKEAFEIFYNRHKRRILNYAYRMTGNADTSQEITQDVFIKAYVNLRSYKEEGKALNWLYTIAGNHCRSFLKRRGCEPRLLLDKGMAGTEGLTMRDVIASKDPNPLESAIEKEGEEMIQRSIDRLPLKYREAIILCDILGYSYDEIARIQKCNIRTIGSRLSRARALIARSLKEAAGGKDV
ncbi:MAG: sigma-70 family RNA polymerase sigma factor [Candidatus Omnitrophota bacterium]